MQYDSTASFLGAHASDPSVKMEANLRYLSMVVPSILPGGGVDRVWTFPQEYGEYDDDLRGVARLGSHGAVYGGIFGSAEVAGRVGGEGRTAEQEARESFGNLMYDE
jgi:hypothetical protein